MPKVSGYSDEQAIALLREVVGTPSPSGSERTVAEQLVARSRGAREAFIDAAGNAVAVFGNGPLNVTFLGHMDTAPGDLPVRFAAGEPARGAPWKGAAALYGRGAVDAKGSLCAALVAASRAGSAVLDAITFRFIAAVEEETEGSRGARYAAATYPPPDLLIIGEPSGWQRYTLGYKGRLGVRLTAITESRHSSREEPNAAELVVAATEKFRAFVREHRGEGGPFYRLTFTLEQISSSGDGLTDRCEAHASLRLPLGVNVTELAHTLEKLAAEAGATAEFSGGVNAHRAPARSELARAFRVAIRRLGGAPTPTLKTGTSDMNVVAPSWSAPTLAYGPGDSNLDHGPREHLLLGEYLTSIEVFGGALRELAAAPRRAEATGGRASA